MSDLSRKIEWAISKFNSAIDEAVKAGNDPVAVAEENIGLLFYVRKIYPGNRFPAWARALLSADAKAAVSAYEEKYKRSVL